MRMLLWTISLACLALWSLLAWGATGLIGAAQSWAPALSDDPLGLGLTAANWADWLGLAGQGAILVIWGIGAILLLVGTALLSRALRAVARFAAERPRFERTIPHSPPYGRSGSFMDRLASRLAPRLLRSVSR